MDHEKFIEECHAIVGNYACEHLDKSDEILHFKTYVVWSCKTLQNNKALLSTTLADGM